MEFDPVLVHEWLRRTARRTPEKDAILCGSERWSYRRIDADSDCVAEALIDLGVRRQDRVAILLGNRPETVVCLYATLKAGSVFIVLDGNIRARRLKHILENSAARVLICRVNQAAVVMEAFGELPDALQIIWLGDGERTAGCPSAAGISWDSIFESRGGDNGRAGRADGDGLPRSIDIDLASLIYTSASTGTAKGVMCTHHNMISAARSIIQYIGNREDDVILNALPLSFDYGLYQVLMATMFGGTVVLEPSFLYLHLLLGRIAEARVTGFPIVPTMVAMLLKMRDLAMYDLSSLRYMTNTGAALPVQYVRRLRELLPHVRLFSMFGLTECKRVCYLDPEELDGRPDSVGRAMPNCEVSVVDEQGNPVEPGKIGELVVRGSNVMQGYWRDGDMSSRVYRQGPYPGSRWLYSGDYFRQDDEGRLYFLGRKDDMIKTRGERVSPREVEDVVCELDAVVEAAAVAVPDEVLGQAIKVFVVTQGRCEEKDILCHCASRLEAFMVPKYVEFILALPRTGNGKIDRRRLHASPTERPG